MVFMLNALLLQLEREQKEIVIETIFDKEVTEVRMFVVRISQWIQIILAVLFIILTLGFIGVEMQWEDGSRFKYRGCTVSKSTMQNVIIFILIMVVLILAALLRCK